MQGSRSHDLFQDGRLYGICSMDPTVHLIQSSLIGRCRYVNLPISNQYHAFAESKEFKPEETTLQDGSKAYWLGSSKAQKVLVWFHGGGYNLPIDPGHFPFLFSVHQANPSVSVLVLGYTLAPHRTYPAQLREAVLLLSHLRSDLQLPASAISIGGDSAGANLALGVLSHLLHPHSEIPALDLGGQKLASCILVAPWATFDSEGWPSVQYNAHKDIVDVTMSDRWSASFLGAAKRDAYNEPLSLAADDPWWQGLDGMVRDICVICGADEVLVDSIRELVKRLQVSAVESIRHIGQRHQ